MTREEMYAKFVSDLIAKSGVREWENVAAIDAIIAAANILVDGFF